MTLEAYIKLNSWPRDALDYPIVSKYARIDGQRGYSLTVRTEANVNSLGLALSDDGVVLDYLVIPCDIPTGEWRHVAVSYTASTGTAEFFVDGVSLGVVSGGPTTVFASPVGVTVGCFNDSNDTEAYWDGLLDEVRIWNTARTGAQIQALRTTEVLGTEAGLVAAWHFNNTFTDATSLGATLTPVNTPTFSVDVPF